MTRCDECLEDKQAIWTCCTTCLPTFLDKVRADAVQRYKDGEDQLYDDTDSKE